MLDRDLAELYGVDVRRLNEQVTRNSERFPERFMHQLTKEEFSDLKSQIATSNFNSRMAHLKSQIAISSWGGVRWVGAETLDMLAKKRKGVSVTVVTSEHRDRKGKPRPTLAATDIAKFNAQYPILTVRYSEKFHDRFLILDDKEIYLIGASLKDLGKKCFAFTKFDAGEIAGLKARV